MDQLSSSGGIRSRARLYFPYGIRNLGMAQAQLRFDKTLNRFLSADRRETAFMLTFDMPRPLKDMIEAIGVPHTEIGIVTVNGRPEMLDYHVADGDQIVVDAAYAKSLSLADARFVADVHLGRLVAYLRMVGFDTLYPEDYRDEELARIADEQNRVLLSRDVGLLKRGRVRQGHFVHATEPGQQLKEVIDIFGIGNQLQFFSRCAACNAPLEIITKDEAISLVQPKNTLYFEDFRRCTGCQKVYWQGSHHDRFMALLRMLDLMSE
jgi:uncharacterized protein with PIN domain